MNPKIPSLKLLIVSRADNGLTLQTFLAEKFKLSNRAAKNLIDNKKVWVNRKLVWMARHNLRTGDAIEIPEATLKETTAAKHERIKIHILFQDDDYLVADKPAGLLSVGEGGVEKILQEQTNLPELRAVHRLDKETTGCLLFAKNDEALQAAIPVFKTRHVKKIYQTIVWGKYGHKASVVREDLDGKMAVSHIHLETCSKDASFLKVRIETGRTHQIRRHMLMLRYPILGDRQYGFKNVYDPRLQTIPRVMLHSCELEMPHPTHPKDILRAHSPLPADFRRCLKLFDMGR